MQAVSTIPRKIPRAGSGKGGTTIVGGSLIIFAILTPIRQEQWNVQSAGALGPRSVP